LAGKVKVLGEIPLPVPICPSQFPHDPAWNQTGPTAAGSWRLSELCSGQGFLLYAVILKVKAEPVSKT
jgi:hypothetical protein